MSRYYRHLFAFICLASALLACTLTPSLSTNESPDSNPTSQNSTDVWEQIANGVEYRTLPVTTSSNYKFPMSILRIDPNAVQFRAHYRPNDPPTFSVWQASLQNDAIAFVNANFFNENYQAIGLLISDGQSYGTSLQGFGGMFYVEQSGTVGLRSLTQDSYRSEQFQQVVQSFPMLIEQGGVAASTGAGFDDASRRTVIAQDRNGRILLMATSTLGVISLNDLQAWLLNSGLDLNIAFALDGGKSTAFFANRPHEQPIVIPSLSVLPSVLVVYGR